MSDRDFCPSHHIYIGLLDVSRGFVDVVERCSDQIDHGDEGMGVSVASCPGASGLEDTVERLHAGVAVCLSPSLEDAVLLLFDSSDRGQDRCQQMTGCPFFPGFLDEVLQPPSC